MNRYRRLIAIPLAAILVLALASPVAAVKPRDTLERWAADTWAASWP